MAVSIVDSEASLTALLDSIATLPRQPPSLYLDLEGVNLCRHGSISILQIFARPMNHTFLIDVFTLQDKAFNTPNRFGTTLRAILESEAVPKVLFDVRNDADALFAHFKISMQGVHDLQLLENATRSWSKKRVVGLAMCNQNDLQVAGEAKRAWKATKESGRALFASELGGSYKVFNERPLRPEILKYCTQDVTYLPGLWELYTRKLSKAWRSRVQAATRQRLLESQAASYDPHGRDKTSSPWAPSPKTNQTNPVSLRDKESHNTTNKFVGPAERAAMKVADQKAAKQPDALIPHLPPTSGTALYQPGKTAVHILDSITMTHSSLRNLPNRFKSTMGQKMPTDPDSISSPTIVLPSIWTCSTCCRVMQISAKRDHLAGKKHIARLNLAQGAVISETSPPSVLASKWTCLICCREMQVSQKQDHLAGKPHIARSKLAPGAGTSEASTQPGVVLAVPSSQEAKVQNRVEFRQPSLGPAPQGSGSEKQSARKGRSKPTASRQAKGLDRGTSGLRGGGVSRGIWTEDGYYGYGGVGDTGGLCDQDCG